MGLEIERKFLLKNDNWKIEGLESVFMQQGYLNSYKERTVRVRIAGDLGFLTIKGKTIGLTRKEFEYSIPLIDAQSLMQMCEQPTIEKTRFIKKDRGNVWEIDVFYGENEGLVLAEIELENENQTIDLPTWVGKEVSSDPKYFNASLIANPYKNW